jgi:hypothetical protein
VTRWKRIVLSVLGAGALGAAATYAVVVLPRSASTDRDWTTDGARLARAHFAGSQVHVQNVRNFDYRSTDDFVERWEDRTYDLDRLQSVWFVVEPFSDYRGPAHTFLSFGFGEGDSAEYVGISVEIRKEKGEHYDPLKALLRNYELMYVVGDERDLVRLRSNFRKDSVFLYRANTTPERARALFVSMLERANALAEHPEFYNTLTSTCTTNIVSHVNTLAPGRVPKFSYKVLLPAFADELAYDLGLLDTSRGFEELRRKALINPVAEKAGDDPAFSRRIRAQSLEVRV